MASKEKIVEPYNDIERILYSPRAEAKNSEDINS